MRETLEAQPIAASTGDWHSQFRVSLKAAGSGVDLIRFVTRIKCGQAWYLSADRKLSLLEGEVSPPFPVGRFIVVETGDGLFKVSFLWGGSFRLRSERGAAEITIDVKDRAACGLSFWGDDKLRDPFGSRDFTISIDRLTALSECIWLEPYPEGARAAICLTDHADFDSIETMRLLVPAFIRNGIRFTKSAFPHSDPHPRKREPGLDVPEYACLIDELYATGSEIAFHGLTPRVQAPGIEECGRRTQMMARYAPQTWIDHGSGAYLFSRNGYLPNGRRLVDVLDRYGILNYWSYFDLWDNPSTHL